MKTRILSLGYAVVWALIVSSGLGCATTAGEGGREDWSQRNGPQISPLRARLAERVGGFQRELLRQYVYLEGHYQEYDRLLLDRGQERRDSPSWLIHRKLYRRHLYLARLHEDRTWLGLSAEYGDDLHLARLHRRAAVWHRSRDETSTRGVSPEDHELERLRQEMNTALPPQNEELWLRRTSY